MKYINKVLPLTNIRLTAQYRVSPKNEYTLHNHCNHYSHFSSGLPTSELHGTHRVVQLGRHRRPIFTSRVCWARAVHAFGDRTTEACACKTRFPHDHYDRYMTPSTDHKPCAQRSHDCIYRSYLITDIENVLSRVSRRLLPLDKIINQQLSQLESFHRFS